MQKTFNVWVKKDTFSRDFLVCSKRVEREDSRKLRNVKSDESTVDCGSTVTACDVSQWLKTFSIKEGKVKSFKLTFKEN